MLIKKLLKKFLLKKNIILQKIYSSDALSDFILKFKNHYISCNLIRVGRDTDGGYLMPDMLGDINYCFSAGVGDSMSFEKELSEKYYIKSFMADASVNNFKENDKNLEFIPKFIGGSSKVEFISLSDWIKKSESLVNKHNKILQMDIEGGEYNVLALEDSETLAVFSSMIIEFHGLEKLFDQEFLQMFSGIFQKIYKNFSICHVHPNNCCGILTLDHLSVPRVMEVTFIRNDISSKYKNNSDINLPHKLDKKNFFEKEDLIMPECWWKNIK